MADESTGVSELQALDALAGEQGAVLAFRACEDSGDVEPVFMRIGAVDPERPSDAVVIEIQDRRGLSLGRYAIPRSRLNAALDQVSMPGEPALVPTDWQA